MKRREFVEKFGLSSVFIGLPSFVFSAKHKKPNYKRCKRVWEKLCGTPRAYAQAFRYIHPENGRPNILLYGDSISMGYTETVRRELSERATVFRLFRNGRSSKDFIVNMEQQRKSMFSPYLENGWDFTWDLIHFNVGLHDLRYLSEGKPDKVNGNQNTPINTYKENLHKICKYLLSCYPDTKLIFATTTPVPEGEPGRVATDALKYNEVARVVLSEYPEIGINDLYSFTKPNFDSWVIKRGNVHYNTVGQTEQGKQVAQVIGNALNV